MKTEDLFPENEKPLDRLCTDGGFAKIFRRIACVGDSLSSGEFQARTESGDWSYHDFYEHSWGQYLARTCGSFVRNFSRGGMTASEYCEGYADHEGFWDAGKACDAYIVALGVNDLLNYNQELGSVSDICQEDWRRNKKTFAGYYGQILQRYREIQPRARFFLVTMPSGSEDRESQTKLLQHAELLADLSKLFPNTYVIDLFRYAPVYDDAFRKKFYLNGHMNPAGYVLTAQMIASYIDWIVRRNMEAFADVGFIGTNLHG